MTLYFTVGSGSGSGTKNHGQVVTITAYSPLPGYEFDGWKYQYGCSIANSSSFTTTATMSSLTSVTEAGVNATYKIISTLYLTVNGGSGDGTYNYNSNVGINADSAAFGWVFYRWTSAYNCTVSNQYSSDTTVRIGSSGTTASISSSYARILYTVNFDSGGGGSISGITSQQIYYEGTGTQVTAVPDSGYSFVNWSDSNTNASRTPTNVSSNATYTANFAPNDHTVDFYPDTAGGYITGNTHQIIDNGQNGTEVIAIPYIGYTFYKWSDNNTNPNRTPTNVTTNQSYTAYFTVFGRINMKWYTH